MFHEMVCQIFGQPAKLPDVFHPRQILYTSPSTIDLIETTLHEADYYNCTRREGQRPVRLLSMEYEFSESMNGGYHILVWSILWRMCILAYWLGPEHIWWHTWCLMTNYEKVMDYAMNGIKVNMLDRWTKVNTRSL
jgi:hypothetical protein